MSDESIDRATAGPSARPVPAPDDQEPERDPEDLDLGTMVDGHRHLTFTLLGEVYAIDILQVTEIIEFRSLTVVPMMPAFVRGVINLRGRVLPVIDLAARFGRGETVVQRRTGVIVINTSDGPEGGIGIIVDAVNKVVSMPQGDIQPPPAFGAGIDARFIGGMARHEDRFVIVLNARQILSAQDIAQLGHPVPAA